jgi:DNA-directed RNA polymerase subunit alpha
MLDNFHLNQVPVKASLIKHTANKNTLLIEPLLSGFGYTLGNSIRRIMLSSVPGYAITKIRINDLTHEYQPIEGVVEDALDIILNLKQLRPRILTDDEVVTMVLRRDTSGVVTANDFEKDSRVEIANPDSYICSLDKGGNVEIEVEIARGVGYLSSDDIDFSSNTNPNQIMVDALFSPVSSVSLNVEKVRVGGDTNFDKISIDFETDGTVDAQDVVNYSFDLVIDTFTKIRSVFGVPEISTPEIDVVENDVIVSVDSLNLPKRIMNILEKNEITTKTELAKRVKEVQDFPGITEKALKTIKDYLKK